MDDHANTFRSAGEDVNRIADRLDAQVEAITFTGPAGDLFRDDMRQGMERLRRAAHELQAAAADVGGSGTD